MAIAAFMKVSVLIPVYNKAPWLQECLDSVFAQTFLDFEVVAVDDASTDDSAAILQAVQDPRLRIVSLPRNVGPAGAANAGLDACRGEYIARLDADDIALPERLSLQVAYMDAHPQVGASGGAVALFGEQQHRMDMPLENAECQAQLLFGVPVSQGASILRRSLLEQEGIRYDPDWPRVGEDWLFWTRLGSVAELGNVPEVLIRYRRGEQNISRGRDRTADHRTLLRNVFDHYGIPMDARELELQLMALRMFPDAVDTALVRAHRAWLDKLLAHNAQHGLFPAVAFARRVEQAWEGLFHHLPRFGVRPAMEHMRCGGSWPRAHLVYLAKYRINVLLGRMPR